jgi:hypothetical protein
LAIGAWWRARKATARCNQYTAKEIVRITDLEDAVFANGKSRIVDLEAWRTQYEKNAQAACEKLQEAEAMQEDSERGQCCGKCRSWDDDAGQCRNWPQAVKREGGQKCSRYIPKVEYLPEQCCGKCRWWLDGACQWVGQYRGGTLIDQGQHCTDFEPRND